MRTDTCWEQFGEEAGEEGEGTGVKAPGPESELGVTEKLFQGLCSCALGALSPAVHTVNADGLLQDAAACGLCLQKRVWLHSKPLVPFSRNCLGNTQGKYPRDFVLLPAQICSETNDCVAHISGL